MIKFETTRFGVTLLEVLVVIFIIGVLAAFLVPAVQSAREASRRVQCSNNLRQLGIGLNSYAGVFGAYPPGNHDRGFSLHSTLLPNLEQAALFHAINFNCGNYDRSLHTSNSTVFQVSVSVFQCPSDPASSSRPGLTSYAGNRGVGFSSSSLYGHSDNGAISFLADMVRPQDVTDGLSHTAAVSEWLVGPGSGRDLQRVIVRLAPPLTRPGQFDLFASACHREVPEGVPIDGAGKPGHWLHGDFGDTLYNHVLTVNDHSCLNGPSFQQSAWTAGSLHHFGANLLYLDGHISLTPQSIASATWRALGTRNGNEAISEPGI